MVHGPAAIYELVSFFYYRICFCHHCIHGYRRRCRSAVIFNGFSDIPLATAQGTNLLFFLPVGAVALLFHKKSGLLQVKRGCLRPVGDCQAFSSAYGLHPGWNLPSFPSCLRFFVLFGLENSFSKMLKSPEKGNTSSGDDS